MPYVPFRVGGCETEPSGLVTASSPGLSAPEIVTRVALGSPQTVRTMLRQSPGLTTPPVRFPRASTGAGSGVRSVTVALDPIFTTETTVGTVGSASAARKAPQEELRH